MSDGKRVENAGYQQQQGVYPAPPNRVAQQHGQQQQQSSYGHPPLSQFQAGANHPTHPRELNGEFKYFRSGAGCMYGILKWGLTLLFGGWSYPLLIYLELKWTMNSTKMGGRTMKFTASLLEVCFMYGYHLLMIYCTGGLWILCMPWFTRIWQDTRLCWKEQRSPNNRWRFFNAAPNILWELFYALVMLLTLGLARPWLLASYYRVYFSNVLIDGKRLKMTCSGNQILKYWIKDWFLLWITFGLYSFCGAGAELNRYLDSCISWRIVQEDSNASTARSSYTEQV